MTRTFTEEWLQAYQARDKRPQARIQGVKGTSVPVERGTERRGK